MDIMWGVFKIYFHNMREAMGLTIKTDAILINKLKSQNFKNLPKIEISSGEIIILSNVSTDIIMAAIKSQVMNQLKHSYHMNTKLTQVWKFTTTSNLEFCEKLKVILLHVMLWIYA